MRPAYLKFKNLKTGLAYCQYGIVKEDGKPKDCADVPAGATTEEEQHKYRPEVLASCVCTPGTECKSVIGNAGVASVASTIFVRIALGTLLERFGPVNVQCGLMSFGAFWVVSWKHVGLIVLSRSRWDTQDLGTAPRSITQAMAAAISAPWNYTLIRLLGAHTLE